MASHEHDYATLRARLDYLTAAHARLVAAYMAEAEENERLRALLNEMRVKRPNGRGRLCFKP
ncbi:hypothetical protein [Asticcacaulis sp.]|uniref:hypothetical protein n=1 Tax=Asticcacaulis sp. TaxID=1872648 RepID=UPI00391BC07C